MAVYVMSDLHGNYEGFMSILEQIHFSEADEMYINGDIVDRERGEIKILQYMMMQPKERSMNLSLLLLRLCCF